MSSYVTRKTPGNTEWFRHDRFGMFIHWGIYSVGARHEWCKCYESISEEHYDQYFKHFDPDLFDAKEWAKKAKAAGMKYAILTTKHHDGFCLFDSKYTDYKCTNTPAGRDLVKEFVDAFRAEGLRIGLYYSLLDWHHPDFPLDCAHPRRNDKNAAELDEGRDVKKYAEYMRNQVTELMTNYGKIDIMWFDYTYPNDYTEIYRRGKSKDDWESEKLIALVRSFNPEIMINNRTGIEQDIWGPEQRQIKAWVKHKETGELVTWETCQTFSGAWSYSRDEMTWKSPEMLINMLINNVSIGGNLLMNVGPTARGYFDERADKALQTFADWMRFNSRSIYGCTMAEPELLALCPNGCKFTQSDDGKRLYVHLFEYPFNLLELPGFVGKIDYAQFLHDGSELKIFERITPTVAGLKAQGDDYLAIKVPVVKPNVIVPVIEIFLK